MWWGVCGCSGWVHANAWLLQIVMLAHVLGLNCLSQDECCLVVISSAVDTLNAHSGTPCQGRAPGASNESKGALSLILLDRRGS